MTKLRKFVKAALILTAFLFLGVGLNSCSKLFGAKITGFYSQEQESSFFYITSTKKQFYNYRGDVYHFINDNTVIHYGGVADRYIGDYNEELVPGWYYTRGRDKTYTYTLLDNKIALTNGVILTIENDGESLMPEGSSSAKRLVKWNIK